MEQEYISALLVGVVGFLVWLVKDRWKSFDSIETRITRLESTTAALQSTATVLNDIRETVHLLRTDIEVIKSKMSS